MGMLLCEQNFRDVWSRNESVRAEIGQILHTDIHTHAAKLVVEITGMDKTCLYTSSGSLFVILSVGMSNVHVTSNVIITYHCSA